MSEDKRDPSDQPTATSASEDLGSKSVLVRLAPEGGFEGVGLRELEDEPPLPEIRSGPEKYQVVKILGEGGMGKVYAVLDRDLKRPVALKMIRAGGDRHMQRHLEEDLHQARERVRPSDLLVTSLQLLDHDPERAATHERHRVVGLLPLAQAEVVDRQDVRVLELGHHLRFLEEAQAIAYAHAKGVLHRDLKPANVMLGEHGEVQVIDWGLAKVIAGSEVRTDLAASLTRSGHLVGTPAYMSPEQARGEEADARTDVYALGAMLYELLTWEPPFKGSSADVLGAVVRDLPVPPRERARNRTIPGELEQACMRALAKVPAERQASVEALHAEVQAWLEAETDREKRHQRAEAKAAEGRALLEKYRRLKREVGRLDGEALEVAKRFEPWQPAEEKGDLTAAEDRAREARRRLVEAAADAVGTLELALGFENENATARGLIADYYWDRFQEAERARSENDVEFFRRRVAAYHEGKYARELEGGGSLVLASEPPGAEVWIQDLVEEGFVVVEKNPRRLGVTPLPETALPMGSYLIVLSMEGQRDTRYPVHITRNRVWKGEVRLFTDEEIGAGFIHVPAGPFVIGGDAEAYNSLERSEPRVEDFLIAQHPVTMGEYLQYVNDVARREGMEAAKARSPRYQPGSTPLLEDGAGGLKLPEVDAEGDRWDARMPVFGVSWHDAVAYCGWRSARDGQEYRLGSEAEWEKAARGVDGRWYPWGWRFDPSLCNMRESRKEQSPPVAVDAYPRDVSVYGVCGLGGNVRDWTATELVQGSGSPRRVNRIIRGGFWEGSARLSRAASRFWYEPAHTNVYVGFRLARSQFGLVTI